MRRLTQVLGTLLLLGGLWATLLVIAWTNGVLPDLPAGILGSREDGDEQRSPANEAQRDDEHGANDPAEMPQAGQDPAPHDPAPHDPPPQNNATPRPNDESHEEEPASAPSARVQSFILQAPGVDPHVTSVIAGQLVGDETPELVVGLGDRVDILQIEGGTLRRIATIHIEQADPAFVPSTPRAAIGDVSGDGQADLVVPYWRRTSGGGSRGGGAVILRGKADGTLDRPRRFAGPRMMVSSLALMNLDGRGGLDVVLGGRGRPFGGIPGRIAYYRGGRRPRLIREQRTQVTEIRFVLPVDIDDDSERDLLVAGETLVRYRRTGSDRFEPLEDTQPGILFADVPHGISYQVPGSERFEALVHAIAANAAIIVNAEGVHRVPEDFQTGLRDVRLSWIRALVPGQGGIGIETLAINYASNGWLLGRLDDDGEPIDIRRLHGGHPRSALDGALVEEDGVPVAYGLETLWDRDTGAITWQILRFPFCACDYDRAEAVNIVDDDALAEWSIR